jgi:predicted permease
MFQTISRVAVFFALIALGALLSRLKALTRDGISGLSAFVYWLGFPFWLVVTFTRLPRPGAGMAVPLAAYIAALIAGAVVTGLIARLIRAPAPLALASGSAALVNNSAFLGVPIAVSVFGVAGAYIGPLIVAADFLVCFTVACAALASVSGQGIGVALARTARNPTVIGAGVGVICLFAGIRFPPAAESAMDLLGKAGTPVALVALGGLLGLMPWRTILTLDAPRAAAIFGKIVLAPALVAAALFLVHAPADVFRIGVFMAACPTAVSIFIQARVYDVWADGAATTVAQSTLISLVTLSTLVIALGA